MKTGLDGSLIDGATAETDTSSQASAHTSARMSDARHRIEVIIGVERRRRWSWEQTQAIARKYGLNPGQLYAWRRQILRRVPAVAPAGFARVDVVAESLRPTASTTNADAARSGLNEVVLPGGASARVDSHVDERALRRVLAALRE